VSGRDSKNLESPTRQWRILEYLRCASPLHSLGSSITWLLRRSPQGPSSATGAPGYRRVGSTGLSINWP